MMVITAACSKGGVGKTTTAITLAHGIARRGQRVLLVDLDPFAYATTSLGVDPAPGLYDVMMGASLGNVVVAARDLLWVVPGNSETRLAESLLIRRQETAHNIASRLLAITQGFDVLVIDTPQGGLLQEASLVMADVTIVPATVDFYGGQGTAYLSELRTLVGADSHVFLLPTMYNGRSGRNMAMLERMSAFARESGVRMLPPVPYREEVRQLPNLGSTIWEHEAQGHGRKVVAELTVLYSNIIDQLEMEALHVAA